MLLKSYTIEIAKGMVESPLGSWSRWWPRHIAFNHHDLMFASGVNMGNVGGMGGVGGVGMGLGTVGASGGMGTTPGISQFFIAGQPAV